MLVDRFRIVEQCASGVRDVRCGFLPRDRGQDETGQQT